MRRRCTVVLVALGLAVGATPASAAPALVAIDDAAPVLQQADDGGWTGTLGLTNLTVDALQLSAAPVDATDADCRPELSKAAIAAAQLSELELTVPSACETTDGSVEFTVTATGETTQDVQVTADLQQGDDPDWSQLKSFVFALPVAVVALFAVFWPAGYQPLRKLKYLEASYDFKESWVSNITVVAAFLTGLFGSADVVKAFLGEDADSSIALATVGSAIALIFIGAGPLVLNAAKVDLTKPEPNGGLVQVFTAGGLLLAAAVTVAGAFGQLFVGWQSGMALEPDGWEDWELLDVTISWDDWVTIGFAVTVALLVVYTLATVRATLKAGTTKPPPKPPGLIAVLNDALEKSDLSTEARLAVMEDVLASYPPAGPSVGAARRRAAMP